MLINTNIKRIIGGGRDKRSKIYEQCSMEKKKWI